MENIAFIDIFTTQNDLYGRNNCPIQFSCEIFNNSEVFDEDVFLKNKAERQKHFNIIPDEHIMPLGTLISGLRDTDVSSKSMDWKELETALNGIYTLLSTLNEKKNVFIVGYNHIAYDLKILNDTFKRILDKEPIEFDKNRLIDIFKICENVIPVTEIGSYSTDSVFEYMFHDLERLKKIRETRSTLTDILLTKMIMSKLMQKDETFTDFLKRTAPRNDLEIFTFGKYKGALISEIIKTDQQYVSWVLKNKTFQEQSPNIITSINRILSGQN